MTRLCLTNIFTCERHSHRLIIQKQRTFHSATLFSRNGTFACLSGLFKQFSGNPLDNPLPQPLPWAPAIKLSGRFAILIKNLIFHYLFNQVFKLKLLRVCTFLLLDLDLQTQLRDLEPLAGLLVLGLLSRHYLHTGLSRERIRWSGLERRN